MRTVRVPCGVGGRQVPIAALTRLRSVHGCRGGVAVAAVSSLLTDQRTLVRTPVGRPDSSRRSVIHTVHETIDKSAAYPPGTILAIVSRMSNTVASANLAMDLNTILAPTGWALMDVTVNTETGFARVVAERRDHSAGTGIKVTLLRSTHATKVIEKRDVIARRDGMYRDFWEVTDASFGGRRFDGMRSALRILARYIDDNAAMGQLGGAALRRLATTIA